jgi:hypothetical protein
MQDFDRALRGWLARVAIAHQTRAIEQPGLVLSESVAAEALVMLLDCQMDLFRLVA